MSMAKYTVAVAGATGYAGGEALRILAAHPDFDITCVAGHSSVGESMAKHMPHIPQLANLVVEDTTPEVLNGHDVIILALPHGASGKLASQLDPNAVVVDLGAAHRLEEQAAWDEFYGGDFYEHWTYGMPELITGKAADGSYTRQRAALPGTKRIAGPGCNVTATTLAAVRKRGGAESVNEREEGVCSISAPIRNASGQVIAAISISGPTGRMGAAPGRRYAPLVMAAGKYLTEALVKAVR